MQTFQIGIINDPSLFKIHVLPARSDTVICDADGRCASLSLNGMWRFHYAENPSSIVEGFEKTSMDVSGWREIPVPSNIQMLGFDAPAYVNSQYPWDGREKLAPGEAPKRFNPTAQYVTFFEVPDAWKGQGVRIRFHGVESGFALWLNGSFIGYSEDSFTPSEFDLTEYVRDGVNRLAVLNFKFTNGSWLEDQDMYRLSGIFRDVELYPVPKVHLEDVRVTADLDASFTTGILEGTIKVSGKAEGAKILWSLYARGVAKPDDVREYVFPENTLIETGEACCVLTHSGDGNSVNEENPDTAAHCENMTGFAKAKFHAAVPDVSCWSAEAPYLYELKLSLLTKEGCITETASELTGFRHFELKDGLMQLNGRRIVFNGVNRHEFSCDTGRSPRKEDVLRDIRIMKRNNINAIRTSHYPNASIIYRLADIFGLYMIAETNMETHGSWGYPLCTKDDILPNDRQEYLPMMLDRVTSQFERDKNHPAILIWSCGNESFGGSVIFLMSQRFHALDQTRLVHYEGIFHDRRYHETSDMESQMYTSADNVERFLEEHPEKPFILCEYTHSMGNSNGGMHRYIELSERNPRFQGGFIWDFVDQAIRTKNRYGEEYLAYGGDFGERPTDYEFSGNGIIDAMRRPYGKIQEVRYNYRTIRAEVSADSVRIINKNLFVPTSVFDCVVTVEKEGKLLLRTGLETDVAPQEEKVYDLPFRFCESGEESCCGQDDTALTEDGNKRFFCEEGEYAVTVSFLLKEDTLWEKKGYETAFGQTVITVGKPLPVSLEDMPVQCSETAAKKGIHTPGADKTRTGATGLEVVPGKVNLGVRGEHFEVLFSYLKGGLVSYRFGGRELIDRIPRPNFWRAPVNNDAGNHMPARLGIWKIASSYQDFNDPEKGIFDIASDGEESWPKILYTDDYVEIIWKKFLPVLSGCCGADTCQTIRKPEKVSMGCVTCLTSYRVFPDGTVRCILDYNPVCELPPMPEFGWMFGINADYSHITYYGMGPEENYCDRREGVKLGVYSRDAADMAEHYLIPQETGNRTGVRWARITDRSGHGVMVSAAGFPDSGDREASAPGTMEFSAIPYSPDQLECAMHSYELPRVHRTYIRCSLKQMGIAGDDSWGARTHPEYLLPNDRRLVFAVDFKGI